MNDLRAGHFMTLFQMLSSSKGSLYISSYGVKSTTLEEVFMKAITEKVLGSESTPDNDSNEFETESVSRIILNMPDSVDNTVGNDKILTIKDSGFGESDPNSLSLGFLHVSGRDAKLSGSGDVHLSNENLDTTDRTTSFTEIPQPSNASIVTINQTAQSEYEKISGNHLVAQQFWAILQKRYLCTKRNIEGLFSQVLTINFCY